MERCAGIEQLLAEFYGTLRSPTGRRTVGGFASDPDALFVGTDPWEWWSGGTAIRRRLAAVLRDTDGLDLIGADPRGFRDGNVAWVADRPLFVLPDGTQIPVRVTAVACQIDGRWQFVQAHLSLGMNSQLPPEVVALTSQLLA